MGVTIPQARDRRWFISLAVLAVLLMGAAFWRIGATGVEAYRDADFAARQFLGDIIAGRDAQAYALLSDRCRAATAPDGFNKVADEWASFLGSASEINGSAATMHVGTSGSSIGLVYGVTGERGSGRATLTLVRQRGSWRIAAVDLNRQVPPPAAGMTSGVQ